MPFSQSSQILTIVGFIEQANPASILDVETGMGQYGFLARNNLELANLFCVGGARATPRPKAEWRVRHLLPDTSATDESIDRLWKKMARDLRDSVVGVRDSWYVRHRYFNHPDKHYDVLVVTSRWSGAARGILVLRRDDGRCELLDVIVPLNKLPALIDQACRLLSHWGFTELYGWITQQHAPIFTATGGQQHALDIRIPTSNWIDGPGVEAIRDKWWLMSGDTDFR